MYATFAVAKRKPEFFSGFLFATAKVACITTMMFLHIIDNIHSQITSVKINAADIALVPPYLMVDE